MRRWLLAAVAASMVAAAAMGASSASAWVGDFFDADASGQAVYERMAIHPQAVRFDDAVYVVYQGQGLAPYLVVFPDAGGVQGPYRIGDQPLALSANPDDSHGAPALLVDSEAGVLHCFWGAHGSQLMHSWASVSDLGTWTPAAMPGMSRVTYPQVMLDSEGVAHLFLRWDANSSGRVSGDWIHATSRDGGMTWTLDPRVVLAANSAISWYANFSMADDDSVHVVAHAYSKASLNPFVRTGVVYAALNPRTGEWEDAAGGELETDGVAGISRAEFEASPASCIASVTAGPRSNQGVCATDDLQRPGLLYLSESGGDSFVWEFARYQESGWVTSTVCATDHFMDAAALEYANGRWEAFVTEPDSGGADPAGLYDDRGGDIELWVSDDGAEWNREATIATSDPDQGVLYNDPQIVTGWEAAPGRSRIMFGEWDNDAGNFVHKVYLWGASGLRGREFFPSFTRVDGRNRYAVAAALSREAFPNGSDVVCVAAGEGFADGLAAAPLVKAYNAPLLLTPSSSPDAETVAEIKRLNPSTVIVFGGERAVSPEVASALRGARTTRIERVAGADRYETAANIAVRLRQVLDRPLRRAVVVSGRDFPDALSVAPLAAVRGMPILLADDGSGGASLKSALKSCEVTGTLVVGGENAVAASVETSLPGPVRIAGSDRYETSARLVEAALVSDPALGIPRSLRMDRFVVARGDDYPDALAGGVFAARMRGPVLLTQGNALSAPTQLLLERRAYRVLDCYVLGGERAVQTTVAEGIADVLRERQSD